MTLNSSTLVNYRAEFFDFDNVTYLDVAGQGPLPRVSERALQNAIEWKKLPFLMPPDVYFALPDRVRGLIARLIGAKPDEVALTTGASTGLAVVANGIDWKPDDEVLVAHGEFPAHFCAFMPLAESGRLRLKMIEPRARHLTADDFIAQISPRSRLVSVSLVRFGDASRIDAARIAEACRRVGAWLVLDVTQCAGAMPLDIRRLGADFAVCAGYKWLLSPYGTGFFWVREDRIEALRPGPFYWEALEGAENFHSLSLERYHPRVSARRWDMPETASPSLAAVEASIELLLRIGVDTIWEHNGRLISYLIDRLPRDRCVLVSPCDAAARGPFICVAGRAPEKTRHLHESLRAAKIFVSLRENALRIAPHVFNTPDDVDRLVKALSV